MQLALSSSILLPDNRLLIGVFALLYAAAGLYALAIPQGRRSWWGFAGALAVLVLAALLVESSLGRMALLNLAALAAVGMVWSQPGAAPRAAARSYLALLLLSIALTGAGAVLGGEGANPPAALAPLAAGLMMTGFAVKLALAPFYFWLPRVTGASGAVTSALIIGALGMAELGELAHLRAAAPWVFTEYAGVWLALALFSMFAGALLALAQRDLKRMLAFSTIDDMGYLLLGVLVGSQLSLAGAVLGAASHALFKALMFGAVGVAERGIGRPVTLDTRGLAARFPVSAAVFIGAALGILGVPPLFGFAGRWRLYLAGVESGGPLLGAAMAAATGLALLYYVRAIHAVWLGAPAQTGSAHPEPAPAEPRLAVAALGLLALAALVLGFFPTLAQALIG